MRASKPRGATTTECGARLAHQPSGYENATAQCDYEVLYDTCCRDSVNMRPGAIILKESASPIVSLLMARPILDVTFDENVTEFQPNLLPYLYFNVTPMLPVPPAVAKGAHRMRKAEGEDVMSTSELAQRSS